MPVPSGEEAPGLYKNRPGGGRKGVEVRVSDEERCGELDTSKLVVPRRSITDVVGD